MAQRLFKSLNYTYDVIKDGSGFGLADRNDPVKLR